MIEFDFLDKKSNAQNSSTSSDSSADNEISQFPLQKNNKNDQQTGSGETLNELIMEEALLRGELHDLQNQQFSDVEDDELREFQKIENEIKVSDLQKCLNLVQRQISSCKRKKCEMQKAVVTAREEAPLAQQETDEDADNSSSSLSDSQPSHNHCDGCHGFPEKVENGQEKPQNGISTPTEQRLQSNGVVFNLNTNHYNHNHHSNQNNHNKSLEEVQLKPLAVRRKMHQRPLTLYLPSPDEELNLVSHITTLGHDITTQHSLIITNFSCSGYLYKLCTNSESKWRKRFFHFDRHHKVFLYYSSRKAFRKMRKPSGGVYFDEIHDVYVDHTRMKTKSNQATKRCVFIVAAARRQFVLSVYEPELMRIWIDVIFTGAQAYQDFED